jgi:hypothetical protein
MRRTILITLLSFVCAYSYSQERFYNLYPGLRIHYSENVNNTKYLLVGLDSTYTINGYEGVPIFISLDVLGNVTETQKYLNDTITNFSIYTSKGTSTFESKIVVSGGIKLLLKNYMLYPFLLYCNINSFYVDSIIDLGTYFNEKSTRILFHYHKYDSLLLLLGDMQYQLNSNNITTFYGVYNTLDNSFYYQDYVRPNNVIMTPYQLHPAGEQEYFISVEQEKTTAVKYRKACVLKIDNTGSEIWRATLGVDSTDNMNARIFDAPDGNYFVVWTNPYIGTYNQINHNFMTIKIAKLIDHGSWAEIINEKDLRPELGFFDRAQYVIQDHYQDESGDIYLLLQTWGGYQSALVKIHANGIGAWMRIFRVYPENTADLTQTMLYGFSRTNDGGFMLTGEYRSAPGTMFPSGIQKALVIKTDSCGCLYEEGCNPNCADSYVNQFIYMRQAEIYPNPASEIIHIKLPEQNSQVGRYNVKIYSLNGSLVKEQELNSASQNINISELKSGLYTIHISGDGKYYIGRFVRE